MAIRNLRESNNLSKLEICNILVDYGFGNEEEGYLDYFLDNPRYCASVNLDDMGAYVDDYDKREHIKLPYANGADRKILRTRKDVDEFLDFISDLENGRYLESKMRKTRNKRSMRESHLSSQAYYDFYDFVNDLNKDFSSRGFEFSGEKVNNSDRNFMIYVYDVYSRSDDEIATIAIDYNESNYEWTMTFDFKPYWDSTGEYDVYFDQTVKLDINKLYPEIESAIDIIGDCLDDNSDIY